MNIDEQKFFIWKAIEQAKITFLDGINKFKEFIANFIGAKQSQETMTPPNVPAPNTI
ncbi:hypothetical protein [Candidatus Regiella insecticola]|uniref:hypothetical protein n=1 Tax=Candidatus Regiella insecticola TaxID=138073 RepID=UPI001596612D|nr:hypothetical protein [Candidatus Regiella insecticola]